MQKYTNEEKEKIQQIGVKYEGEWEEFLKNLKGKYQNLTWDSLVDEGEIPKELNSFLEIYFENREEIEELPSEETEIEETEKIEEENKENKSLAVLVQEKSELDEVLKEKEEELESADATRRAELKKRKDTTNQDK